MVKTVFNMISDNANRSTKSSEYTDQRKVSVYPEARSLKCGDSTMMNDTFSRTSANQLDARSLKCSRVVSSWFVLVRLKVPFITVESAGYGVATRAACINACLTDSPR